MYLTAAILRKNMVNVQWIGLVIIKKPKLSFSVIDITWIVDVLSMMNISISYQNVNPLWVTVGWF